ncbi:hypothetical protein [Pleurocapsa sp. CCALA 161]|uniref:hypothetical protein n=1 Tax=Pleurocapsa sp. CCALA 161 TaxID=2107688 RepID=UPI0018EB969C|nr:hypothetical protein [Pleurocapsa sp. CCALA 161]
MSFPTPAVVCVPNNALGSDQSQIKVQLNQLLRQAAQLKARELATPELAIRAIADRMTEEDLPEDLKQKVEAVREAVYPKWTPGQLADSILSQYRSQRNNS